MPVIARSFATKQSRGRGDGGSLCRRLGGRGPSARRFPRRGNRLGSHGAAAAPKGVGPCPRPIRHGLRLLSTLALPKPSSGRRGVRGERRCRNCAGRGVRRPKTRLRPSGHGSEPKGEESEAEAGAAALAGRGRGFEGGHPGSPAKRADGPLPPSLGLRDCFALKGSQ